MHCFVKDIPLCLAALSFPSTTLTAMDLVLTNIANSPSLEKIFKASKVKIESDSFSSLKELSMDSSHLTHVNLSGATKKNLYGKYFTAHYNKLTTMNVYVCIHVRKYVYMSMYVCLFYYFKITC